MSAEDERRSGDKSGVVFHRVEPSNDGDNSVGCSDSPFASERLAGDSIRTKTLRIYPVMNHERSLIVVAVQCVKGSAGFGIDDDGIGKARAYGTE